MSKKAVVLLSGGLDSATTLAIATSNGFECSVLTINYGQKQTAEIKAAKVIAKKLGVIEHCILDLPLGSISSSALLDRNLNIPDFTEGDKKIPTTYVPARNTIFLSLALGWAETLGAEHIFIGVTAVDYSGYPDCRESYIKAFAKMALLATKNGIEGKPIAIETPLIRTKKRRIIELGLQLGIDYGDTISCYQATSEGFACGRCSACNYRKRGFEEIGMPDPTRYTDLR